MDQSSTTLYETARQPFEWSRAFLAPPGMPENMVSTLRAAILETLQDPEFLADAEKSKIQVHPVPGEKVQQLIQDYLKTPQSVIDRMQAEMAKDIPN
jgi:tripartite-type tricarboxylate transporter receptor subunit TctC